MATIVKQQLIGVRALRSSICLIVIISETIIHYEIIAHTLIEPTAIQINETKHVFCVVTNYLIIIITSHRLIARWGQLRLLLGSACTRFLPSFCFYGQRYLHPFPSNVLTDDILAWYE